ncbi:RagB/SusD family nutrient uptake outer membrane protein [Portibacter lacus]|uniref:Membrane protein n=1 Tax=Portibacter lacus TaxID=1099794 RepID=A0AA37WDT8_9BACT|nr:RagB/SusD family nutrient uptake outer membrane protein [Portibacter lacus]GLR15974.1 membrane protein [Portibacter lacus]
MKKYIFILLSLLVFASCEKQLTLTSPSELTSAGFWDTENGARAAHTGLYGTLRGSAGTLWLLGEIRSDLWGGQTFESPSYISLIESNITVTTAPFGGWAGLYSAIHKLNDFIANVPEIEFVSESEKSHMIGQAYGLRALYYYTLLKTWGEVPIVTNPVSDFDPSVLSKARSSETQVMDLIKSDLELSLAAFGTDFSFWNNNKNYWSRAASLTLKGEVYIWSGKLLGGGDGDFTEALTALNQVADGSGVSLVEHFSELWGVENENNSEFIFALQYKQDEASNFYNSLTGRTTEIHPQFDDEGNSMSDFIIGGSNRLGPSEKTLLVLDDSLDYRRNETFIRLYVDGEGYPGYNSEKYFGAILNKFLGSVDGSIRIFENDVPVYRYADVLLLIAEAKNNLGQDPSAEINLIRQRAYADNYDESTHAYVSKLVSENANAILKERYKEFIAEGKRWWDLRRAGDNYVIENVEYLSAGDEYKLILPITEDMIGRNPDLAQTTGY